ncbi:hypothetical protein T11_835 [Trichinella zimbabwensis]|uniref:Uncharacterized protein n=1 Tax=Trichinella zimbabwensis TaxID=268475 RepID=A0A0V1HGB6_9BILA|nr:hypothetical protein T11_835 [Trichinella zimbabwensis]
MDTKPVAILIYFRFQHKGLQSNVSVHGKFFRIQEFANPSEFRSDIHL